MKTSQKIELSRGQQGFTLIELSIVLVIIGVIFGVVLGGREIIRQAQIRQAVIQLKVLATAINQFEVKYYVLPGDMPNATEMFSSSIVRNGNGNEHIDSFGTPTSESPQEWAQAYVHLSQAEFIPGAYTGTGVPQAGVNIMDGGDNRLVGIAGDFVNNFGRTSVTSISLARPNWCEWCYWGGSGLTIQEAKAIDSKLDDGTANAGRLYGIDGGELIGSGHCSAAFSVADGADYNPVNTDKEVCRIFYYFRN